MTDQQKVLLIVAITGLYIFLRIRWLRRKWHVTRAKLAAEQRRERGE